MPTLISIDCPECGTEGGIPESFVGRKVHCFACGHPYVAPRILSYEAEPDEEDDEPEPEPRPVRRRRSLPKRSGLAVARLPLAAAFVVLSFALFGFGLSRWQQSGWLLIELIALACGIGSLLTLFFLPRMRRER